MFCAAFNQMRFASTCSGSSSLAMNLSKRCISYEDRGRNRCQLRTEPFHADLMPLPKKKRQADVEAEHTAALLDASVTEYTKNMQLGATLGKRYDEIYYSCAKKSVPRRYAQTWVEGPEPVIQPKLLNEIDKHIDPAPIEKRKKEDERPKTAKPMASTRRFHSWYQKLIRQ